MATIETQENETIELLQTHYYKASYDEIKSVYLEILKELGFEVYKNGINDDYGEIYAGASHIDVTAKIIMQTPKETSIDFFIDANFLFSSTKKAHAFILDVYNKIEKKYPLKGLSLHK